MKVSCNPAKENDCFFDNDTLVFMPYKYIEIETVDCSENKKTQLKDYYRYRMDETTLSYIENAQCYKNSDLYLQAIEGALEWTEIIFSSKSCFWNFRA